MKRPLKKLVFVEPKSTHLHIYSRVTIPRLGSVLLGTIMRDKGYDVRVYIEDIHPIDMREVLSADLVAISAITSTAPQSYRLADTVREAGVLAVLGGTHVSFLPEEGIQHADFVVRGEGEFAFQELVDAIERGEGFETIQNLSYLDEAGRLCNNVERPKIPNLDVNPIPDYRLITGWKPGGVISVATSRGCPFSCTFCSVPGMYGHAFRTHSIGRVLDELALHKESLYTFFADDIFTANKKRVKELLRGMIDRNLARQWGAQVRTETVDDPELLQLMRDSNCFNVYVGFESINPRTLKLFKKKQDVAKIERAIERFHANDIQIHGMFVIGSDEEPGDARRDRALRPQARHRLGPVHDHDPHPRLARLGFGVREGDEVRHQRQLADVRRPPRRPSAAPDEPLRVADGRHQGHGAVLLVDRHRQEAAEGRPLLRDDPVLGQEDAPGVVEGRREPRARGLAQGADLRRAPAGGRPIATDGRPPRGIAPGLPRPVAAPVPG
jgi:hypothetical protein